MTIAIALLGCAGCAEVATPDDLAHTRVVAVRATPPGIPSGATSRLDVLAATQLGELLQPTVVSARVVGTMGAELLSLDDDGWFVRAPTEEQLTAARAAAGIADGAPVPLLVEMTVEVDDKMLVADKLVMLGASFANPNIEALFADGRQIAGAVELASDTEVELTARTTPDSGLNFAWATSTGELTRYRDSAATLTGDSDGNGTVIAVVRDENGGVAWSSFGVQSQ